MNEKLLFNFDVQYNVKYNVNVQYNVFTYVHIISQN